MSVTRVLGSVVQTMAYCSIQFWTTADDSVGQALEPRVTRARLFFPLRCVPYPNASKPEQQYDVDPARGEESIGGETEIDKIKASDFPDVGGFCGCKAGH